MSQEKPERYVVVVRYYYLHQYFRQLVSAASKNLIITYSYNITITGVWKVWIVDRHVRELLMKQYWVIIT